MCDVCGAYTQSALGDGNSNDNKTFFYMNEIIMCWGRLSCVYRLRTPEGA